MRAAIDKLKNKDTVTRGEAADACRDLCASSNMAEAATLLELMSKAGETAAEICGFADVMREKMITVDYPEAAIDIVGTGGDGANTVNISTAASLVVATCGATVIKHGNRASSSSCGSADFLETCGIELYTTPQQALDCLAKTNYVFLHKPAYHPIAEKLKTLRQELKIRTIFNLLGPLLNPAHVRYLLLGVYTDCLLPLYADALLQADVKHALVVHGNGLDELNCLGINHAIEVVDGDLRPLILDSHDFGFDYCDLADLQGGDAAQNVKLLTAVLTGQQPGPIMNTIALNAGAALYVYGIAKDISSGVEIALESLIQGKPYQKLQQIIGYFNHA